MEAQNRQIIHRSIETLEGYLKDYLSFGVKSHSIFVKILFREFLNTKSLEERRILRAKILFEYFLAMEELFAYAYAFNQENIKNDKENINSKHQNFRDALFDYTNIQLDKFVRQKFERRNLDEIFGFPDEAELAKNLKSDIQTVKGIYDSLSKTLNNAQEEFYKNKVIFFKLKHCFLIKERGPGISEYKGDEVFIMTRPKDRETDIVIEALPLEKDLVAREIENISEIENQIKNMIYFFFAKHKPGELKLSIKK